MRPVIAALIAAAALSASPARADSAATARAEAALADLTRAFWVGPPATGHLRLEANKDGKEVGAWEQAQAVAAYYGAWKYIAGAGTGRMVGAEWNWIKHRARTPADLVTCGPGAQFNFASDDTGWDVGLYLQAYEETRDPAALAAAEGSLDCAWRTWWDDSLGGGYWYNDERTDKTSYQAVLTLDSEWVFRLTGLKRFQEHAIASEAWTVAKLGRDDGLYWKSIHRDGALPQGKYLIEPGRSVTMIVGNMAQAVAEVWLGQDTGQAVYFQRAQATAAGIVQHEVDKAGVLINDQDSYTDGWAMIPFAHDVVSRLPQPLRATWATTLQASAAAVWQADRHVDSGTFGADWGGPVDGVAWARRPDGPALHSKVSVSGGAVNVAVAAATIP